MPYALHGRWTRVVATGAMGAAVVFGFSGAVAGSQNQKISSGDPYGRCTVADPGGVHLNPSAEEEPFVAVGPKDHKNVIAVWQQDRWDSGGARGLVAGVSRDGGQHFDQVTLPFSRCAPGGLPYTRASDPWVSIGPDGTAYAVSLSFNQAADGSTPGNTIGVATSTDGGLTWGNTQALINDTDPSVLNDKESVTADPVHPGVAYVVWDRATPTSQPTYFSKTADDGKTWSTPRAITAPTESVIGDILVVDPRNGTLYDFFDRFVATGTGAEESFIKSTDGGATWSAIKKITDDGSVQPVDPANGALLRTSFGDPDPAIDTKTGRLYVVWEDARFSGGAFNEIAFSTSGDGGATWSTPQRISTPTGGLGFNPQIAVNDKGVLGVSYYDFRTLPTADPATLPTNYWLVTSPAGGGSFGNEQAIVRTPFDQLGAPVSRFRGYFLGDYEGFANSGDEFVSVFIKSNEQGTPENRTDVFFAKLDVETGGSSALHATAGASHTLPAAPGAAHVKARQY
jgi:hypothetical protein